MKPKKQKQQEATERAKERAGRGDEDQIARLDALGLRASKERKRIGGAS